MSLSKIKIMKNIFIIFYIVSISSFAFSQKQNKIQIIDYRTKKPVSFVTIFDKQSNKGFYCDENGYFLSGKITTDTIILSCIGYELLNISKNDMIKQDKINMYPKVYNINEIVISPDKKQRIKKYSGFSKCKPALSISNTQGAVFATLINNPNNINSIISEIIIPTRNNNHLSKKENILNGFFRIHLYSVNEKDSSPNKELLNENLTFNFSDFNKKNKIGISTRNVIKINISEYNIMMPRDGIFVGIEWLGDNLIENTKKRSTWQPFVCFTKDTDQCFTWTKDELTNNKWELVDKEDKWNIYKDGVINAMFGIKIKPNGKHPRW